MSRDPGWQAKVDQARAFVQDQISDADVIICITRRKGRRDFVSTTYVDQEVHGQELALGILTAMDAVESMKAIVRESCRKGERHENTGA